MPADYVPLSWISNLPDPVQSYAHGLQIGSQIGSEQARQQLQQQQMLQQQQEQQVRQAHDADVFQLQSQAQARKFAAQQKFDSLVQSGIDPAKALLQVAPDLGESLTGAAQLYKASQPAQMSPFQQAEIEQRKADREERQYEFDSKQSPDDVFQAGPVKGQPVLDPSTGQPIPGLVGVPSPSGKGMTVHLTPKAESQMSPNEASRLISSGEADSIDPSGVFKSDLIDLVRKSVPHKEKSKLTKDQAKAFLEQAGGDKTKARQLAKDAGYEF